MLQALVSALSSSCFTLLSRFALSTEQINNRKYILYTGFFSLLILALGIPYLYEDSSAFFTPFYMGLMLSMGLIILVIDILFTKGLQNTDIEHVEPLYLSRYIFTIIIAVAVFPTERNLIRFAFAFIASVTLLAINIRKHHLEIDKYSLYIILAGLLTAVESNIANKLLEVLSPYNLFLFLLVVLNFLYFMFFNKQIAFTTSKDYMVLFFISFLSVVRWVFMYWSFNVIGVVNTTLILTSAPLIEIVGAKYFLKEKFHWRFFLGTAVIILCIMGSYLY